MRRFLTWLSRRELRLRGMLDEARTIVDESCDRCRVAPAMYEVTLRFGRLLYLCGHHYNAHAAALAARGYKVREVMGR